VYKTASIVLTLDFLIELIIRVIGCRDWPFDDVVIVFSVSRVTLFSLGPSALLGLDGRAKINTFIFGTSSTHVKCIGTKGGGGYRGRQPWTPTLIHALDVCVKTYNTYI
jgi:hypothetical protein